MATSESNDQRKRRIELLLGSKEANLLSENESLSASVVALNLDDDDDGRFPKPKATNEEEEEDDDILAWVHAEASHKANAVHSSKLVTPSDVEARIMREQQEQQSFPKVYGPASTASSKRSHAQRQSSSSDEGVAKSKVFISQTEGNRRRKKMPVRSARARRGAGDEGQEAGKSPRGKQPE